VSKSAKIEFREKDKKEWRRKERENIKEDKKKSKEHTKSSNGWRLSSKRLKR
jgi:hypothetical protein